MNTNPYQAPGDDGRQPGMPAPGDRTMFVLAAVGAWLASAYWGALTLLLVFGATMGTVAPTQVILPLILIGLYAYRGLQLFKGDPAAAKRILWLHGLGAVAALMQMFQGGSIVAVLQVIKIVIHIFGAVTAMLALRSQSRASAM